MKNYLYLVLVLILAGSNAHAARFSLLGGIDYNMTTSSTATIVGTIDIKGGLGYGGGLLIDLGKIETGAIFTSRAIQSTFASVTTSITTKGIEIPLMYRFGGLTSFGLGGFYALSLESGGGSNYGLTAGPRFAMTNGFYLDLRFDYGLKTGNTKDVLAMVGYYFGK